MIKVLNKDELPNPEGLAKEYTGTYAQVGLGKVYQLWLYVVPNGKEVGAWGFRAHRTVTNKDIVIEELTQKIEDLRKGDHAAAVSGLELVLEIVNRI